MSMLKGKRVGICATRRAEDIVDYIAQHGGIPVLEDLVRIEYLPEEEVHKSIEKAVLFKPSYFLFTTGEGAKRLFQIAREMGDFEEIKDLILSGSILARGYKTRKILLEEGFKDFQTLDHTKDFIRLLKPLEGRYVLLQMYGEEVPELEKHILKGGGVLLKVWVYRYVPDEEKIDAFIDRLLKDYYHAVIFTSAFQVKTLFQRAKKKELNRKLAQRMNNGVLILSVGRTTAKALFEEEVLRVLFPQKERLSLALKELEKAFRNG